MQTNMPKITNQKIKEDILMAVSTQGSRAIYDASEELKNDKDIILAVVIQHDHGLEYASEELRQDKELVLAAVTQKGMALKYVNETLKTDKGVVLAAVRQNGLALMYTSDKLQKDKDVVLAAVTQNSRALRYASAELQNDKEMIWAALTSTNYLGVFEKTINDIYGVGPIINYVIDKNELEIIISYGNLYCGRKIVKANLEVTETDIRNLIVDLRPNCLKFIKNKTPNNEVFDKDTKYLKTLTDRIIVKNLFGFATVYAYIVMLIKSFKNEKSQKSIIICMPEDCRNKVLEFINPKHSPVIYDLIPEINDSYDVGNSSAACCPER